MFHIIFKAYKLQPDDPYIDILYSKYPTIDFTTWMCYLTVVFRFRYSGYGIIVNKGKRPK